MNAITRIPRWLTVGLLWLSCQLTASAFYNPETGRWLNRDPIDEKGGVNLLAFVQNAPVSFIDTFGTATSRPDIVTTAFAWLTSFWKDSEVVAVSRAPQALMIIGRVLPQIRVAVGGVDQPQYRPLTGTLTVEDEDPSPYTVVHEMVHAWNHKRGIGLDDRRNEGAAYATEQMMSLPLPMLMNAESSAKNEPLERVRRYVRAFWQTAWKSNGKISQYPGGQSGIYVRTDFKFDDMDFHNVRGLLRLHISCREMKEVINNILERRGMGCLHVSCEQDPGSESATHIPAGAPIDPVFQ